MTKTVSDCIYLDGELSVKFVIWYHLCLFKIILHFRDLCETTLITCWLRKFDCLIIISLLARWDIQLSFCRAIGGMEWEWGDRLNIIYVLQKYLPKALSKFLCSYVWERGYRYWFNIFCLSCIGKRGDFSFTFLLNWYHHILLVLISVSSTGKVTKIVSTSYCT